MKTKETNCCSMTTMFLEKLLNSGIIEHRRIEKAMKSWPISRDENGKEYYDMSLRTIGLPSVEELYRMKERETQSPIELVKPRE